MPRRFSGRRPRGLADLAGLAERAALRQQNILQETCAIVLTRSWQKAWPSGSCVRPAERPQRRDLYNIAARIAMRPGQALSATSHLLSTYLVSSMLLDTGNLPVKMILLLFLAQLASAHFQINYPGSRGFDHDKQGQWPCGGLNNVSAKRVEFPLTGGAIQIHSGHTEQLLEVLMAVGDEPGDNFNVVLVPTFLEKGPGDFCFGDVSVPQDLNITEGTNATLQVIASGHNGGLYGVSTVPTCPFLDRTSSALCISSFAAHLEHR